MKQALANAAREAAQALQASLNKAQAQAAQIEKKAQGDLAKANTGTWQRNNVRAELSSAG